VLAALRHTKGRRAGPALKAEIDAITCKSIVTKQQQQRHPQQQQQQQLQQQQQQQQRRSAVITVPSVQRTNAAATSTVGSDTDVHSSAVQVVARHRTTFDAATATANTTSANITTAAVTAATASSSSDSSSGSASAAVDANANALALSMIRKLQQQLKSERQERAVAEAALQNANMGLLSARIRKDNSLLQRSRSAATAAVTAPAASSTDAAAGDNGSAKHR
jgi:hypothetical protein